MNKLLKSKKYGSAMVLSVLAIVLLAAAGLGLLSLGLNSRLSAVRGAFGMQARAAADAGLAKALYEMNEKLEVKPWNDSSLPSETDSAIEDSSETYSYSVTKDGGGVYHISSTGTCSQATRTVSASLDITGPPEAILVANKLSLKNNFTITGSCGTLSADGEDFDMGTGVITGDAFVGVGGNPDSITCTVSGRKYTLNETFSFGLPTVPSAAATANPNTDWTTPVNASLGTVGTTTYVRYTGVTINGTLSINGDVVMYINGNLSDVGSGINVNNNSSLKLYISGDFGAAENGVDLSSTANDPSALRIYGVGTSTQNFTLGKNKATTVACIYAPNADVTIGKNDAVVAGQIITNSFSAKNNADIAYDSRAAGGWSVNDSLVKFEVKGWHE
jgi:hypothetical protein